MNGNSLNSCLYTGRIRHRRLLPAEHVFDYDLFMVYLDLAELDAVFRGRWLWSTRAPALAWWRRRDHFGDPDVPLDTSVRDLVAKEIGRRPQGPIRLLTHLRYFGYCFNPISIYYCFSDVEERVEAIVAEVTNTPWGERCCYVLADNSRQDGRRHRYRFAKRMHVSPFMPMGLDYLWRCNEPSERLSVHMDVLQNDRKLFDATLALRRRAITGASLSATLSRFPMVTLKVIAAIHWEALRLWFKRAPLFDHPAQMS
jgi:DUF1365 family protein